ncbi:YeiH family protein [Luteipulveratus halotolerans]|uniref:Membrane protein n=1 Tax=Luteipulveratus halotolerans TaxID=1631356 RepID=A0A0L6CIZ7_9MICO|nr:putative sulfate exporter family transporter [Luteipulveratus halotolerans]KNX37463.1 membrane protein [Luteipulveratus halotolerans]
MTSTVSPAPVTHRAYGEILPGLAVCVAGAAVSIAVHALLPVVSPLFVAIVLGALLAHVTGVPARVAPGVALSSRTLLRAGVVLLGIQLSLSDVLGLGPMTLVAVVAVVVVGIAVGVGVGTRLGLSHTQAVLLACGFSICGAAAVAATDGVVDAEDEEVATAVSLVVVFGTAMIVLVPLGAHALGLDDRAAGLWAGLSIHEVAQVVAAGGAIGGSALAVAVVAKLARVLMLAPVMALIGVWQRRRPGTQTDGRRTPLVPLFVLGFLALAVVRTVLEPSQAVLDGAAQVQTALLATAMFALGCGVSAGALRRAGWRVIAVASVTTAAVLGVALAGVVVVGR